MSTREIVERLEEAARQVRSGDYEAQAVRAVLAPVDDWLYEQVLPPCTCGHWKGTPDDGHWYCRRHRVGAGSIGSDGATWSYRPPSSAVVGERDDLGTSRTESVGVPIRR